MGHKLIKIADRKVGRGEQTFIIAEIGINHNGDMKLARRLITEAKQAGVDAVKLQTYITEKRVTKNSPIYCILKQCELSFDQQKELFELGRDLGVMVFSTPFDEESVDFLASIDCPIFKIASFDSVNLKLLRKVAATGRPVILSTGMTSLVELSVAWSALGGKEDGTGCDLAILHCISAYPTNLDDANLAAVTYLDDNHGGPVGFSDHTIGIDATRYSIFAGATLIEKHFTLDCQMDGPDHKLSADLVTMKALVEAVRQAEIIRGIGELRVRDVERDTFQYRRQSS